MVYLQAVMMLTLVQMLLVSQAVSQCEPACAKGYKCMLDNCVLDVECPAATKIGAGPPAACDDPTDPNGLPPSQLEKWFTEDVFNDLFPKANIGWGPNKCWPYSYQAFAIAARYFPKFGVESPANNFSANENMRRDLAAFFSHAVQETGENDASLYSTFTDKREADACFYRGGFYNWFEGGPVSAFLPRNATGSQPKDGDRCIQAGRYCTSSPLWQCSQETDGDFFTGCYFGRGAIQLSYNFNYGQFQEWLSTQNISVDLLKQPNLIMTKMDPPLAVLASLWFYMTPQPPKPAMHDIVMGKWIAGDDNVQDGYYGAIFGPTSLVINNECGGEDTKTPGGPGESRRIKAFKWFSQYFGFRVEEDRLLSCKSMKVKFDQMKAPVSYQPDWTSTWKPQPCDCAPATYGGEIPYYAPGYYDQSFVDLNEKNRKRCVESVYANPDAYSMKRDTNVCLDFPPGANWTLPPTTKAPVCRMVCTP